MQSKYPVSSHAMNAIRSDVVTWVEGAVPHAFYALLNMLRLYEGLQLTPQIEEQPAEIRLFLATPKVFHIPKKWVIYFTMWLHIYTTP